MNDIPQNAITTLIGQWESLAREARERSRTDRVGDVQTAYYYKGVTDTYQQVIDGLRTLLGSDDEIVVPPPGDYLPVSEQAINDLLTRAGLYPRTLHTHDDHALTAVFSRLQPISQEQRLSLLAQADPRIIILDQGKLSDSNDPFIDFAFRVSEAEQKD
jgi:hypothetical protein